MPNILTRLVSSHASQTPDREAYYSPEANGEWKPVTWRRMAEDVDAAANALAFLGVQPQTMTATFSANRPEGVTVDFAAYANRAVPVSIYSTSSLEQVVYILNDTSATVIFVGNEAQLAIARAARRMCPKLRCIVVIEPVKCRDTAVMTWERFMEIGRSATEEIKQEVAHRTETALTSDIATLVYTSGTTGEPKGAVLPHSCFNRVMEIHKERLSMLDESDTSVAFLPMSHIFEKAWTYFCLYMNMKVWINLDPKEITKTLRQARPTSMCSVPRFWEKVYAGVNEKIAGMGGVQRALVSRALKVGRKRNLDYVRTGRKVPWLLEKEYKFYDKRVFQVLKRVMGVERGKLFPTAGAAISPVIVEFLISCGIPIVVGYGLSETTATVSCYPQTDYQIGSVGVPLPGIDVRIGENNEIQVKSATVMRGYYNKPVATGEAFTADGWFRTGDAGRIDPATGAIFLTERLKDLFKTSNGKYVAPQAIESRLGEDPVIEQVAVIGDQRKFVTALIVPSFDVLREYAARQGIAGRTPEELVKSEEIHRMIEQRLEGLQQGLANHEKIKRFTLLPKEFTMENGELTNTLKVRRPVVAEHYKNEIEQMYKC